jgi:hypothetical protein
VPKISRIMPVKCLKAWEISIDLLILENMEEISLCSTILLNAL